MNKKKIKEKLKNKYRLIVYNDGTSRETFSLKLSLYNIYIIVVGSAILFIIIGILLVTSTPVKRILPNSEYQIKSQLYKSAILIDSLENMIATNEKQYQRLLYTIKGQDSLLVTSQDTLSRGNTELPKDNREINYIRSSQDSILRDIVEAEERFNVTHGKATKPEGLLNLYLYPPITNGVIIASYQQSSLNRVGIDIAAQNNAYVMATAEGTVISANWSLETGYSIMIQHENNLISSYQQNSELLKKVGDQVYRGEAIAIIGNTGENSSGLYLHFELWHDGKALDPQDFITF